MRSWIVFLCFFITVPAYSAPDYAREKEWAREIAPNIVVGDPIYLKQKNGHQFLGIYAQAAHPKMGVVIAHGMGLNPDWGVIGTIRQRLVDYGYTTLSIQMPVLARNAGYKDYVALFPDAAERLKIAVAYLKAKGYRRIAVRLAQQRLTHEPRVHGNQSARRGRVGRAQPDARRHLRRRQGANTRFIRWKRSFACSCFRV